MAQDWEIKARSDACAKSGKGFIDEQAYVSRLTFGEEGYVREDFSEEVWEDSMADGALSVWRGVFRLPPPPPEEALKKETAEALLRKFMEEEDPGRGNAIYILAIMLERRRILVERDVKTREGGAKLRVYEHRKTNETFVVRDPGLKLSELHEVQEDVVALLGGKPPARATEETAEAEEQAESGAEEEVG